MIRNTSLFLLTLLFMACSPQKTINVEYATFNIRYDNPADGENSWSNRRSSVKDFILSRNLDIIGMQEVLHNQLTDLEEDLPQFDHVGVAREDGKQQGEYAPIFYNKNRFDLVDSNTFWLSQYPDSIGFIGWDGACTRIATWAKLREKETGKEFLAVNTHFDHVGTEARHNGAILIMNKMKEIAGEHPAILTGDFNISDKWEAYETLTNHSNYPLKDSRKTAQRIRGAGHTFHGFGKIKPEELEIIDFIFVTPQVDVERSMIISPTNGGTTFLSDHNPVIVTLHF